MADHLRIALTSCIRHKNFPRQPQWQQISNSQPDCLFLLGDHIYMDFGYPPFSHEYNGKPRRYSHNKFERTMREKYQQQWQEPHFRQLVDSMRDKGGLFATWDDHDFAWNNACGSDVPADKRETSRALFHEFLDCSRNHPHIYCHADLPLARAIVLDNRFYAEPPGRQAALLGDEQWQFLTEKLTHNRPWTLVASGLSLTHGQENWARYPAEYQRLCTLLRQHHNVIWLAGDIHDNVLVPPSAEHPCHEVISSGMAVNRLGLPFGISNLQNWAQLDLYPDRADVLLHSKKGHRAASIQRQPQA